MEEHHYQEIEDVGIAWDKATNRIWVCINGTSLFRAKLMNGEILIEYYPMEGEDKL